MSAKKKPFNKYSLAEAYAYLHVTQVLPWTIPFTPIEPGEIFRADLERLQAFDVTFSESGKEILIDTILQEALSLRKKLKVWKEVTLKADDLSVVRIRVRTTLDRADASLCLSGKSKKGRFRTRRGAMLVRHESVSTPERERTTSP